ncbi:MAG: hypothetical protein EOP86_21025 [Verrucomicrobiaceae bacterium]|nr:MAG: hypothetical protein EOP86_21025 [Verrucomicrobiaceae bacterium]
MKRQALLLAALPSLAWADPSPVITTRALDPDTPIIVPTAANITTTLEFPKPIQGIDGVGLTASPKENAQVLFSVSHVPGTRFVSFTPLTSNASTNANFIYEDEVYVFILKVDAERALFKMRLTDPQAELRAREEARREEQRRRAENQPDPEERETLQIPPARLLGLMDKVMAWPLLRQDPENVSDLERSEGPFEPSETPRCKIQPLSVTRKGAWDALVFEVAITNKTKDPLFYDPESFLAGAGPRSYAAILADAAGEVPAGQTVNAWFIIQGDAAQGSNNLSPDNVWMITVQELEQGEGNAHGAGLMPQSGGGKEPIPPPPDRKPDKPQSKK